MLEQLGAAHAQLMATVKAQQKLALEHTWCEDKLRRIAEAEKDFKRSIKGVDDGIAARAKARDECVEQTMSSCQGLDHRVRLPSDWPQNKSSWKSPDKTS
jgi:hypothetical protein